MVQPPTMPTVRELIAEYATIEDRVRTLEAGLIGGGGHSQTPELMRLANRERQVRAMLRSHPSMR